MKVENCPPGSSLKHMMQNPKLGCSSKDGKAPATRSRNSVRRKSGTGEGNHTLDVFNFMIGSSKTENIDAVPYNTESEDHCSKSLFKISRPRLASGSRGSSVRLRDTELTKPADQDRVEDLNGVNLTNTWSETNSVFKERKRSHPGNNRDSKNLQHRQSKKRKSAFKMENSKAATLKACDPSGAPCRHSNATKSKNSRLSAMVRSQRKGMRRIRNPSDPQVIDKNSEVDLSQTNPTTFFGHQLWTDQYSPSVLSDMVLNSSDVSSMVSWMKSWSSRSDSSLRKASKIARRYSLDDFSCSEDSYDSSASDSLSWRRSAYLILGPTGCGKTCLVYTMAMQFGFKVFELNPSACRSGKEVTSQCSQVMFSQHVSTEGLPVSSSMFNSSKPNVSKSRDSKRQNLASFFQPEKQPLSKSTRLPKPIDSGNSIMIEDGLKLNNKSLILFDEVDVLYESDRGFWVAVGKLLQLGRRPIILTASDSTVVHRIPVPILICRLKPLTSPTLVKPVLQRICESQGIPLADWLIHSLTSSGIVDHDCDIPNRISSTARRLVSSREFSNIRQSIVKLQWLLGSKCRGTYLPIENTGAVEDDLLTYCVTAFPSLFSLSWGFSFSQKTSQAVAKPKADDFGDIFDSENEKEADRTLVESKIDTQCQIGIPLAQSKKLSSDLLSALSRYSEIQGLLDVCSTQNSRKEISRGISALPTNLVASSSTTNLLAIFEEVYSAPFSGIDPEGTIGGFAVKEDWKQHLYSVTSNRLQSIEQELTSTPPLSQVESGKRVGCYVNQPFYGKDLLSSAFNKAVRTLSILKALSGERNSGESLFQPESALDYLPALRDISKAEIDRRGSSTRRRFLHYFDQIGLLLSDGTRGFLSQ